MSMQLGDTADHVLRRLLQSAGFVSGEALATECSLSRMAVSKAVQHLRELGYSIESVRGRGYRFLQGTERPIGVEVQRHLDTEALGRVFVYEEELPSTNRLAADFATGGAPEGLVVTADRQLAGQGRRRRSWFSPSGCNLYVSVVLRPAVLPARVPEISLMSAVALRRALGREASGCDVRVKWPNDIWVGGRKVAGILCEMESEFDQVRHVVVGVGINVNVTGDEFPPEVRDVATSLRIETGRCHSRAVLLAQILNEVERVYRQWLAAEDLSPFVEELACHSVLRDRTVAVEQMGDVTEGRAVGIAPDGRLVLQSAEGERMLISSGDAHIRRD